MENAEEMDVKKTEAEKRTLDIIGKMLEMEQEERDCFIAKLIKGEYKYLITFDMGCGNTSAAVVKIAEYDYTCTNLVLWRYLSDWQKDGVRVELKGLSIPTMLGYDETGKAVIGSEALLLGDVAANFKTLPVRNSLAAQFPEIGCCTNVPLGGVWRDYFAVAFRKILKEAKKKYPDITSDNLIFVVAHPADEKWMNCLEEYRELIEDGTRLQKEQILTFSEAKASMEYVCAEKGALDWSKGVIIIDMGASTLDVEYLVSGKEFLKMECSLAMAGKEVDGLLGNEVLLTLFPDQLENVSIKTDAPQNNIIELYPNEVTEDAFFSIHDKVFGSADTQQLFLWNMRRIKESVSGFGRNEYDPNEAGGAIGNLVLDRNFLESILATKQFSITCSDPAIAMFMTGGKIGVLEVENTWYGFLSKFVEYVATEISKQPDSILADKIIVTGGSANLPNVKYYINQGIQAAGWKDWNSDNIIVMGQPSDYERTVPYGSASYLLKVMKYTPVMLEFPGKLMRTLEADLCFKCSTIIRDEIYPVVSKKIQTVLNQWASPNNNIDTSINGLKKEIDKIEISQEEIDAAVTSADKKISALNMTEVAGKTVAQISSFLNSISVNGTYDKSVDFDKIKLSIDIVMIKNAIMRSCDTNKLLQKYFTGLQAIMFLFGIKKAHNKLNVKARNNFIMNFQRKNSIGADICAAIQEQFKKEFAATEGFGMVEEIIRSLETDINQAMFLG